MATHTTSSYTTTQTPGIGQYCSVYINGFTTGYPNNMDILRNTAAGYVTDCGTTGCTFAISYSDTACSYMDVCQEQSHPACPWSSGPNCGVFTACTPVSSDQSYYGYSYEGWTFCNTGCAAVAPCTQIPNATFSGAASPTTSPTGCPFSCNNGYYLSGASSCAACTGLPNKAVWTGPGTTATNCPWTCGAGYYLKAGVCTACPLCTTNGYYNLGGGGASCGSCAQCTN